jgi:glucokinase
MPTASRLFVGVDIGKTKIAAGAVSTAGRLASERIINTDLSFNGRNIPQQVESLIRSLISSARGRVSGIGISAIGIVDSSSGTVKKSSITALDGLELGRLLRDKFKLPTTVDNDINCPAFGEYVFGAGKGSPLMVYLTISTGAGISTIRSGVVDHGAHNLAGFIGNTRILRGGDEFESLFSGSGIANRASAAMGRPVTAGEAFELARDTASPAYAVIKEAVHSAAATIAIVQMTIDPERIVLGGSVATNQPVFVRDITKLAGKMVDRGMSQLPTGINLAVSGLGQYNGVMGAAAMAMQKLDQQQSP